MNIAPAIRAFGEQIGLPDLELNADGLVSLALSDEDSMHLEQAEDDLLVYRLLNKAHISTASLLRALQACNQQQPKTPWMPQMGLIGQDGQAQLVLLCRLDANLVSEQTIEQAVNELERFKRESIDPLGR